LNQLGVDDQPLLDLQAAFTDQADDVVFRFREVRGSW
jgi:hypothetical protein